MTPLLLIPARKGSKRLPGKNLLPCGGKRLIDWTIEAALESNIGKVAISTNIKESVVYPQLCNWRPDDLCEDDTPMIDVVKFAASSNRHYGPIIVLQPTSPLRTAEDIRDAWDLFTGNGSLASYEDVGKHQRMLTTNGAIWIIQDASTGFYDSPHGIYLMPRIRSVDVDTQADLQLASSLLDIRNTKR